MKINARLTMLFREDGLKIEVRDADAGIEFLELRLTPEQTMQAMSRLSCTEVESCEVRGLDRVGKRQEMKPFSFSISADWTRHQNLDQVREEAKLVCPEGWSPDLWFNSQGSITHNPPMAHTTIRRWVEKQDEGDKP